MLYESCRIGILPPQQEALKYYGFHGIYHGHNIRDLYHLWQIYIILIIIHHCPVKEIIDWCQRGCLHILLQVYTDEIVPMASG